MHLPTLRHLRSPPAKSVCYPPAYGVHVRSVRLTILGFILFRELTPRAPPRMHFPCVRPEVCRRLFVRFPLAVDTLALD